MKIRNFKAQISNLMLLALATICASAQPVPPTTAFTRYLMTSTNQSQIQERLNIPVAGAAVTYNLNTSTNLPYVGLSSDARANVTNAARHAAIDATNTVCAEALVGTIDLARLPVGVMSAVTNSTAFVRTNGNNATAVKGRADRPFLTLTAAQAAMATGDTCDIGDGQYIENLTKTGVEFRFSRNARVIGNLCVTNNTTVLTGPGVIYGESINATNAIIRVKDFGLFAAGYASSAIIGTTNIIQVDGCEVVYFSITDAGGYGPSNTLVTVRGDFIASIGAIGEHSTASIFGRRIENKNAGPVISSTAQNQSYVSGHTVLLTDQDQYSVELGAKLTIVAAIFTADKEEYTTIIGGLTPEADIGTPSATYGTNLNFGYWTCDPTFVIPAEPLTRFSALIGF